MWCAIRECKKFSELVKFGYERLLPFAEECWWIRDCIFVVLTGGARSDGYALEVLVMLGAVP